MAPRRRARFLLGCLTRSLTLCLTTGPLVSPLQAHASPSSEELVRQGLVHEQAGELDVAIRRYSDAVSLDRTTKSAYLALGRVRTQLGDYEEATRIYSLLLQYDPASVVAVRQRARARFLTGDHRTSERELEALLESSWDALAARELATEYLSDALYPAALSVWRRALWNDAVPAGTDARAATEARTMVSALTALVDTDPVAHPTVNSWIRRSFANMTAVVPSRQVPPMPPSTKTE